MDLAAIRELRQRLHGQVGRVVVGQEAAVDLMLLALLSEGHVLLEGVPGTAKTLLAQCFAACLSLPFKRIQRPKFPFDRDFEWEPKAEGFGG